MTSKEQTTEALIQKIAVEPPSKESYGGWWILLFPILTVCGILGILSLYPRTASRIHLPTLFPDFLWIVLVGFSSFWFLYQLRFPEESFSKTSRLPIFLGLLWIFYSGCSYVWDLILDREIGTHFGLCSMILFLSSLLLAGSGIYAFRKGRPGNLALGAGVLTVFSLALANFCLKFVCRDQSSYHILFSHGLPSFVLFFMGILLFKKIIKW
ncbi:NrsF family protein [Leptospira sp. WS92.C1]